MNVTIVNSYSQIDRSALTEEDVCVWKSSASGWLGLVFPIAQADMMHGLFHRRVQPLPPPGSCGLIVLESEIEELISILEENGAKVESGPIS